MTFYWLLPCILVCTYFSAYLICAEVIYEGSSPTTEFQVVDRNSIELSNPFRANARLKISFEGNSNLTRVIRRDSGFWWLNDTFNDIAINVFQTKLNNHSVDYHFNWFSYVNHHEAEHEICFHLEYNGAVWFSTFLETEQNFVLNVTQSSLHNKTLFSVNSGQQIGPFIENVLFNTDGFALALDPSLPLALRIVPKSTSTSTEDSKLCFSISSPSPKLTFNDLSFYLLIGENIQQVHNLTVNKEHFIQESNYRPPDDRMFQQVIWNVDSKDLNSTQILHQVQQIHDRGFSHVHFVLNNWEATYGDLDFDKHRFPDPKSFIHELRQIGNNSISLSVQPFVANSSIFYQTHRNYLIKDNASKNHDDPLIVESGGQHGGLLDFTDNFLAFELLWSHLYNLRRKIGFDSCQFRSRGFDLNELNDKIYHRKTPLEHYPNLYAASYAKFASRLGRMASVDTGYHTQSSEIFVKLADIEPTWSGLKSMLNSVLSMSIAGYSFMIPSGFKQSSKTKPTEELYIRWLQVCTFMPSIQLSTFPWSYSEKVANLTVKFVQLRHEHTPTMIEIAKLASKQGEPLIRPMWYLSPNDPKSYQISDQFALGNNLIVAPVLSNGAIERSVYLPAGNWLDQHGKSYTGGSQFKVLAPLDELVHFTRKSN